MDRLGRLGMLEHGDGTVNDLDPEPAVVKFKLDPHRIRPSDYGSMGVEADREMDALWREAMAIVFWTIATIVSAAAIYACLFVPELAFGWLKVFS